MDEGVHCCINCEGEELEASRVPITRDRGGKMEWMQTSEYNTAVRTHGPNVHKGTWRI